MGAWVSKIFLICVTVSVPMTNMRRCRYHFVTTTCAIIGGVFTRGSMMAGMVDGLVHTGVRLAKKGELGKHT